MVTVREVSGTHFVQVHTGTETKGRRESAFNAFETNVHMPLTDLIPTLQLAIGPVILVSGVGLILLSMTNRFGRLIDRSRLLTRELQQATERDRRRIVPQLRILSKRSRIIRAAIALASMSVLLAALLIIALFLGALLGLGIASAIVTLFILCMLSLIASLLLFISDINQSLKALALEMAADGYVDDGSVA